MLPSTHWCEALKKSTFDLCTLYSLCAQEQIAVIALWPRAASLWVMGSEHLSCHLVPLDIPQLARTVWVLWEPLSPCSLDWEILIWPWKSGPTNLSKEFCWCGSVPWARCTHGLRALPVLWLKNLSLLSPLTSLHHGLLTQDSSPKLSFWKETEFPIKCTFCLFCPV